MNKKNIIFASKNLRLKRGVLAKKKERVRRKLVVTAKKLAVTAKGKESVRRKLAVTAGVLRLKAKKLVGTAKEKEGVRNRLVVTAKQLATTAKEKESIRRKLAVTAVALKLKAKNLAVTAKEKESIRRKLAAIAKQLATTAKEKESIRRKLAVTAENLAGFAKEKESIKRRLEVTAKNLAKLAKEKESVRRKLAVTAKNLDIKAKQLAVIAKEKEDTRSKLAITARQLAVTAEEKESIRRKLEVTADKLAATAKEKEETRSKLAMTAKKLAMTAEEKEDTRSKLAVTAKQLAATAKERESVRSKLAITAKQLATTAKEKEIASVAAQNVLKDLSTEKSKVEVAKAKEEAVLLSIGDGLIATDEKGKILLINKAAEKLIGKSKDAVTGKFFSEVILVENEKGEAIPIEKQPVSMALATGTITATTTTTTGPTYYYVKEDKTKFPVAITVTPVILGGKVTGTIEVFRDITREKEIDKAKSEFVSLASHQLRTPTTAINWFSEMLLGEEVGVLNEKQKDYLEEIHHGNKRMIDLVNSLLSVSRIELGTFAIQPGLVNTTSIIDDVLEELQTQVNEKKLNIEKKYGKDTPVIQSDSKLIRIIFQNLLSNAVAYAPSKGKIFIEIRKTDTGVHAAVEDSGCGIPQSEQSKIYTKFFRADNARKIKPDGTGLGLYITKSIVEALGGDISFKSKEGEGTIFSVNIPNRNIAKKAENRLS